MPGPICWLFRKKISMQLQLLDSVLTEHKGEKIEDDALLKQAMLYEEEGEF